MKPYYEEDGITIYCADCRDVLPMLPKVDLVLTDPPYGIGYASDPLPVMRKEGRVVNHVAASWDETTVDEVPFIATLGTTAIIWGGNYYPLPPSRGWLCWNKPDSPPSMADFELGWTNRDTISAMFSWSIAATNAERVGHPTQKPLALMKWCIEWSKTNGTILDPFMGSGTTLVAAKKLDRKCIGIEINEKYCEIAARRLQDTTPSLFREEQ